jgi:hypothetical protein
MIDPESWPAHGYLTRFLSARADVTTDAVINCRTLDDQLAVFSSLAVWDAVGDTGVTTSLFWRQ